MSWLNDYNNLSTSPVFLEEVEHVYIHKKTLKRYSSVTTALSLIKNEFPHEVKQGLIKQNEKFISWINKRGYNYNTDKEFFLKCLTLYINYKHFRPYEVTSWKEKTYKKYKRLESYKTIGDFLDEFLELESLNEIDRKKNIYLNSDGSVMSEETMQQFWYDITDIANIYGTMVHEIVEQYILLKQKFIIQNNIEEIINERFIHLKELIINANESYILSSHVFDEYKILVNVEEFKKHIIDSFNSLNVDLGRLCIPEKLMFNETYEIAGTCDVFIDVDDNYFDIGDHKTNKKFTYSSEYGNKLKSPFNHLDECDLNLYNLQLSIYALLEEIKTGKKLRLMWISYYSRQENVFKLIKLKYLKTEALQIIELFRNYLEDISVKYTRSGILKETPMIYHNHLMFIMEKLIAQHKSIGFYEDKSKKEIQEWFINYIKEYVIRQDLIKIPN